MLTAAFVSPSQTPPNRPFRRSNSLWLPIGPRPPKVSSALPHRDRSSFAASPSLQPCQPSELIAHVVDRLVSFAPSCRPRRAHPLLLPSFFGSSIPVSAPSRAINPKCFGFSFSPAYALHLLHDRSPTGGKCLISFAFLPTSIIRSVASFASGR